jgi:hypothetical protein
MLKNVPDVATPDALISAVGTKVFLNMEEVGGRSEPLCPCHSLLHAYLVNGALRDTHSQPGCLTMAKRMRGLDQCTEACSYLVAIVFVGSSATCTSCFAVA